MLNSNDNFFKDSCNNIFFIHNCSVRQAFVSIVSEKKLYFYDFPTIPIFALNKLRYRDKNGDFSEYFKNRLRNLLDFKDKLICLSEEVLKNSLNIPENLYDFSHILPLKSFNILLRPNGNIYSENEKSFLTKMINKPELFILNKVKLNAFYNESLKIEKVKNMIYNKGFNNWIYLEYNQNLQLLTINMCANRSSRKNLSSILYSLFYYKLINACINVNLTITLGRKIYNIISTEKTLGFLFINWFLNNFLKGN